MRPAGSSAAVTPGAVVRLTTLVRLPIGVSRERVKLKIATGPARRLTVTATAGGHHSTATITSATSRAITLVQLHYGCALPPRATFCPPRGIVVGSGTLRLTVDAVRGAPPSISSIVGPVRALSGGAERPGNAPRPVYSVATLVHALAPPSASAPAPLPTPFGSSVSASRADKVTIVARALGTPGGSPQPITVGIDEGPAKALRVTSSFAGGAASTATIRSASGRPIVLRVASYTCLLPPSATFCPADRISLHGRELTLSFSSAPGLTPIALLGVIAGG